MAVAVLLRQRALSSPHAVSCRNGSYCLERLDPWALPVYTSGLFSNSDLHSKVNSTSLRFWRTYHNSGKFDLTDLTHPHMWYPKAREKKRNVFLHVGPTNSGKTYSALKRLEASSSGVYCGPLRLLAREVAQRLNKVNVPCNLITGQERNEIEGAKHSSVTVEMADMTTNYQCAVIDEIQMYVDISVYLYAWKISKFNRSYVVEQVQYYERLSPLVPLKSPLGSFSNIKAGDCLVSFSRRGIYKLKKRIEREGKHLCSVVYGSLPPETRTKQATMFNDDTSDLNVLVASDAIGMGLNLNISRIIFSTMMKFDGFCNRELTVAEIKQIAGRAGRYGSKFPVGEVTCLNPQDLPLLHSSLKSASSIIERAGLFPTFDLLSLYSRLHGTDFFHPILERFLEKAKLSPDYFITDCEDMLKVAAIVDDLPLGLYDKYLFCMSPVDVSDDISAQGLVQASISILLFFFTIFCGTRIHVSNFFNMQFAENYARKGIVRLKEIFTPGTLQVPKTDNQLKELESVHKVLELYVWLSFRMDDSFPDREVAASQKSICSMLIEEYLERFGWQPQDRRKVLGGAQKLLQEYDVSQIGRAFNDAGGGDGGKAFNGAGGGDGGKAFNGAGGGDGGKAFNGAGGGDGGKAFNGAGGGGKDFNSAGGVGAADQVPGDGVSLRGTFKVGEAPRPSMVASNRFTAVGWLELNVLFYLSYCVTNSVHMGS
ncbi:DExH-box ATP-dependent RNA helicase DExH16 mitochondrial [Zea mays]|uniref:DExH-box ATP-dependent RNA helicase DExH16 mitochondrial n=1 Tax=Zea mays TaxID=4577 RepID=A0A1D6L3Z0_MAIZE|nr:DExH-box ATP-dependent RNA helicase DExH16 mitochondrial [Zea mays]